MCSSDLDTKSLSPHPDPVATGSSIGVSGWETAFGVSSPALPTARRSRPLDLYRIVRDAMLILMLFLVNKAGFAGAIAFFAVMVIMAMKSPRAAFQALALIGLALMINTFFVPKTIPWTVGRLALPLLILVRFANDASRLRISPFTQPHYVAFLLYVGIMAVCSIASGWYTNIALLKLFFFWSFITTVMLGVAVLRERKSDLTEWFVSLVVAATLIGFLAIAVGQSRNMMFAGRRIDLFNGVFLHANCHSLYGSVFTTFLATLAVIGAYRNRWVTVPLIGCWLTFMTLSGARSSLLATVIGLFALFVLTNQRLRRFGARLQVNVPRTTQLACVVVAMLGALAYNFYAGGAVWKSVVEFVNKREMDESEEVVDFETADMVGSRQALIEYSWKNFLENPVFGIGFGVAKTAHFVETATYFTAAAEKGVLATAVLEEGGVLGATAFVCFVVALFLALRREKNVPAIVTLITFLGSNLGEATFISAGGMGGFGWVMVGAAMILGDHCWQPQSPPRSTYAMARRSFAA